jgi:hypothetical protein
MSQPASPLHQKRPIQAIEQGSSRNRLTFARIWVKPIGIAWSKALLGLKAMDFGNGRLGLPGLKRAMRLTGAAIATALLGLSAPAAMAQGHGENFSAKPAPALFASDCTGGGCHKGPQGLGKNQTQYGLASFLREHYTNSRESAAALASYIMNTPRATAAPADPRAARTQPGARASRAPVPPETVPPATAAAKPDVKPDVKPEGNPEAKPEPKSETSLEPARQPKPEGRAAARLPRGRHSTAATTDIMAPSPESPQPATPAAAPKVTPKHYDIFD